MGSCGDYRYGFNGQEKDNEVKGNGNSYTTEFRQYDPRLGRWLSLDPLAYKFPWQSPYAAFDNDPISKTDPNGLATTKAERLQNKFERKYHRWVKKQHFENEDPFQPANRLVHHSEFTSYLEQNGLAEAPRWYRKYREVFPASAKTGYNFEPQEEVKFGASSSASLTIGTSQDTKNVPFNSGMFVITIGGGDLSGHLPTNFTVTVSDNLGTPIFTMNISTTPDNLIMTRSQRYTTSNPGNITVSVTATDIATNTPQNHSFGARIVPSNLEVSKPKDNPVKQKPTNPLIKHPKRRR